MKGDKYYTQKPQQTIKVGHYNGIDNLGEQNGQLVVESAGRSSFFKQRSNGSWYCAPGKPEFLPVLDESDRDMLQIWISDDTPGRTNLVAWTQTKNGGYATVHETFIGGKDQVCIWDQEGVLLCAFDADKGRAITELTDDSIAWGDRDGNVHIHKSQVEPVPLSKLGPYPSTLYPVPVSADSPTSPYPVTPVVIAPPSAPLVDYGLPVGIAPEPIKMLSEKNLKTRFLRAVWLGEVDSVVDIIKQEGEGFVQDEQLQTEIVAIGNVELVGAFIDAVKGLRGKSIDALPQVEPVYEDLRQSASEPAEEQAIFMPDMLNIALYIGRYNPKIVALVKANIAIGSFDGSKDYPLHYHAANGNLIDLQKAMQSNSDQISQTISFGKTDIGFPLVVAARNGHLAVVQQFVNTRVGKCKGFGLFSSKEKIFFQNNKYEVVQAASYHSSRTKWTC
ncbi:MAG: hypothetical protein KAT71_00990 [Gammaproteobacteria bacterium]|nr:hypothetical protein [Gammaproteobacteria bacterium]